MAQDGLQNAGLITATTTAAIAATFTSRMSSYQVTAATSGGIMLETGGPAGQLATTSSSYQLAPGEKVTIPLSGSQPRRPGVYSGFNVLGLPGVTSTARWIALG